MSYTTADLITKVKLWAALPTGQSSLSDAQILDIMTDELRTNIAPFIVGFREDFYVTSVDYTISAGTSRYPIPSRAISTVLKDVNYVNTDGREVSVPRVPVGDKDYYTNGFYIEGNDIVLQQPENREGYTLRVYYYIRPSKLVTTTECARIIYVNATSGEYEISSKPSSWGTTLDLDITQGDSPYGLISTDNSTTFIGLNATPTTYPTGLAVGDYASLPGESCIAQIPLELIPLLVQATVLRVNEILNDPKGMDTAKKKYDDLREAAIQILSPRVVEEPKVIMSKGSFLEQNNVRWRLY